MAYPDGVDCTWLGVDQFGAVAAFVTAGEGEIPCALLAGSVVDLCDIEALLMALPVVGGATLHVSVPRPDDFLDMAYRGLYVYDWSNEGYVLVAAPSRAIQRSGLNEDLKLIADLAVFKSIDFSQHAIVSVGSMTEVIQPGM